MRAIKDTQGPITFRPVSSHVALDDFVPFGCAARGVYSCVI